MVRLSQELRDYYEFIRVATPELEDYKEYVKKSQLDTPVSQDEFLDVGTIIGARMIPKNLELSQEENEILLKYNVQQRIRDLMRALDDTE